MGKPAGAFSIGLQALPCFHPCQSDMLAGMEKSNTRLGRKPTTTQAFFFGAQFTMLAMKVAGHSSLTWLWTLSLFWIPLVIALILLGVAAALSWRARP